MDNFNEFLESIRNYAYDYEQFLENWNIWKYTCIVPVSIKSEMVLVHVKPKKIEKRFGHPNCEIYIYNAKYKIGKKWHKESFKIIFSQDGVHGYGNSIITELCAIEVTQHISGLLYFYRFKPTMLEKWTDYDTGKKYAWWLATNREICDERYIL